MFEIIRETPGVQNSAAKLVAILDARTAADTAARVAQSASEWATRSELAIDDATEVWAAAARARLAAERAEIAATAEEAWAAARAAWAAVTSAQEADARINAAIAESLTQFPTAA